MTKKEFNKQIINVSRFFQILSNPIRLKILTLIQNKKLCVNDIVEKLKKEQSAISHQLAYLKKHCFVKTTKSGKVVFYELYCHHIDSLIDIALNHINSHCKKEK